MMLDGWWDSEEVPELKPTIYQRNLLHLSSIVRKTEHIDGWRWEIGVVSVEFDESIVLHHWANAVLDLAILGCLRTPNSFTYKLAALL